MGDRPAIVFSADELNPARVDEPFLEQAGAFRDAGFRVWVLAPGGQKLVTRGDDPAGARVVFRGWMMKPTEYQAFEQLVTSAGAHLLVSSVQYRMNHYIDGWINELAGLTPETVLLAPDADVADALRSLGWDRSFLKDFVKSLKTARGSIAATVDEAIAIVDEMKKFRGEIEGGFAIRRVEAFRRESERRYFVLTGVPWSADGSAIPGIVDDVAKRLAGRVFYSVDVISREDDVLRIVEVGDGQVSDLVGWEPARFAEMWKAAFPETR